MLTFAWLFSLPGRASWYLARIEPEQFTEIIQQLPQRGFFSPKNLVREAIREGLAGLWFSQIKNNAELLKTNWGKLLQQYYYTTLANNIATLQTADNLIKECQENKLPVVPLKGSYLINHFYKDPGLRPMSDIDLLVPKDKLPLIDKIIRQKGFVSPHNLNHPMPPGSLASISYTHKNKSFPRLHIHWSLWNSMLPCPVEQKPSWAEMCFQKEDNSWHLKPEWLIISLAFHSAKHGIERLIMLEDLWQILTQKNLVETVSQAVAKAQEYGYLWALKLNGLMIETLLGKFIPSEMKAFLANFSEPKFKERIFIYLAKNRLVFPGMGLLFLSYENDKVSLKQLLFPPKKQLEWAYERKPKFFIWLLLRRIFRGIFRIGFLFFWGLFILPLRKLSRYLYFPEKNQSITKAY